MLRFAGTIVDDPARLIPYAAALAVVAAVLAALWPYLQSDPLNRRLARVSRERESLAGRARQELQQPGEVRRLRHSAPSRGYQMIVDSLKLGAKLDDAEMTRRLRQAGFRGRNLAVKFLAFRVISTVGLGVTAFVYTYVVLQLSHPLPAHVALGGVAAALGYAVPGLYLKNTIDKRKTEVRRTWPDALDLMLICVESGMSIEAAFRKVAEEIGPSSPVLAEELSLTTAELTYLQDRRAAYEALAERTDLDAVHSVVTSLVQAEKYGTPIGKALRVNAQESRDERMSLAEKRAAALPPKLTVPMVLFFLPVLFAIIMTPAVMEMIK